MQIIFDAVVAGLIFKIFGEQGLWVLAITCMVTVIRTSTNINNFFKGMIEYALEMFDEEEE